jgi:NAD+--asparagine ADP-ribosyltransferase
VNAKKVLTWVGVAFVVFFVLSSPNDAGNVVKSAFSGIESAANQLATFVKSLA